MFDKNDMMVSVLTAENKVFEIEKENKRVLNETVDKYNEIINSMKKNSKIKGVLKLRDQTFDFGEETPYFSKGLQLYTGDEVEFISGNKGVIVIVDNDYYVYTNSITFKLLTKAKMAELGDSIHFMRCTPVENLVITKHFNELMLDEEIAKGRKGGEGFIVTDITLNVLDKEKN